MSLTLKRSLFSVFSLSPSLRLMDFSANKLSSVPLGIRRFTGLKSLFLNHNRLQTIPEEIGQLVHLEMLSVAYNFLGATIHNNTTT